jgi:hypothetical protein
MGLFSTLFFALVVGFFVGHGASFPPELFPMIVAILFGWIALKATEQISSRR